MEDTVVCAILIILELFGSANIGSGDNRSGDDTFFLIVIIIYWGEIAIFLISFPERLSPDLIFVMEQGKRTFLTDTGIFFTNFTKKSRYPLGSISVLLGP